MSEAKCEEVGLAYFIAKEFYPEKTGDEICEVVLETEKGAAYVASQSPGAVPRLADML